MPLNAPGLNWSLSAPGSILPPGFGSNTVVASTAPKWWQSLLTATGQTFVNGLAATYNQQNQGNPYNTMGLPSSAILMYGVLALLIFKFIK